MLQTIEILLLTIALLLGVLVTNSTAARFPRSEVVLSKSLPWVIVGAYVSSKIIERTV